MCLLTLSFGLKSMQENAIHAGGQCPRRSSRAAWKRTFLRPRVWLANSIAWLRVGCTCPACCTRASYFSILADFHRMRLNEKHEKTFLRTPNSFCNKIPWSLEPWQRDVSILCARMLGASSLSTAVWRVPPARDPQPSRSYTTRRVSTRPGWYQRIKCKLELLTAQDVVQ